MAHLSIRLLGPFDVRLDDRPVSGFVSDKVRALLAYLVTESDRAHRRETLAGLLWPDVPEASARNSLRTALVNLRSVIGDREADPPFLHISRSTLQFKAHSDVWCDVTAFRRLVAPPSGPPHQEKAIQSLKEAVELYRGSFLEGFSLADSAAFEDWALLTREQLQRQGQEALTRVTTFYEQRSDYAHALPFAWRQVELDPWREEAQRQLMRLLAATDRRADALAQYEAYRRLVAQELGIEPVMATTRLYQEIHSGKRGDAAAFPARSFDVPVPMPLFLTETVETEVDRPAFVGREQELHRLHTHLQNALDGRGQVVFVVGGAGRGKTVLLQEFARQATGRHALAAVTGYCNAYSGGGDSYLPFRQVLQMLTGDVEDLWAAERITTAHATRLWRVLPAVAQEIVEVGPDLIETLLSGPALFERASAAAGTSAAWLPRLGRLVNAKTTSQQRDDLEQHALIDQYARVLGRVAQHTPLVIILEDLHWADRGSIELLLHVGRRLAKSRILIVGAYRPNEIATGRDGEPGPFEEVVNELGSLHGTIVIDLARADPAAGRQFVNDLLDVEPNRLGDAFRQALYRNTGGHPLFTVEMLRMLQEQRGLVRDADGFWVQGRVLAWDRVPARVEAVIQKRVGRLDPLLHELLAVASVQGEDFDAQVVSRVVNKPDRQVLRLLSQDLGQKHRLLQQRGELETGRHSMSRFRFSHHLVQRYVYESLSAGERRLLQRQVAEAIEDLFADDLETVTIQLAYHYGHTEEKTKTLHYLTQAGHQARKRYDANQAAHYYTQALSLAADNSADRFHLLAARAAVYDTLAQRDAQKADIDAMEALATRLGERGLHCDALLALSDFYLATEMFRAREPAEQARTEAREIGDDVREARALRRLSWEGRLGTDLQTSRLYLEQAADQFKKVGLPGEAAGCLLMLARRLPASAKHVFELDLAEQAMALADQSGDYGLQAIAKKHLAIAYTNLESDERALPIAQESLSMQRDLGDRHEQGSTLDVVGVILARLGRREEAFAAFQRCLTISEEIGSDWGVLGAVFGFWNYQYVPDGEYERLFAFIDERLRYAAVHERAWLSGFLYWLKTKGLADVGHYDEALSLTQTGAYHATEPTEDLVGRVSVLQLAGSAKGKLGHYDEARQDLERALAVAEKTSDPYLASYPLVDLANLALCQGGPSALRKGLEQAQRSLKAAHKVGEERQLTEALDVSARLYLALGQPGDAYEHSSQAMQLLDACPWLPKPQNHLHTHSLILRTLERQTQADEHLERAYERVQLVADKFADESLRQGWLQNVRANREIVGDWNEIHSRRTDAPAPKAKNG